MAGLGNTLSQEVELKRQIELHTAAAVEEIDISSWLGWGEGIPVLPCVLCGERTVGRITFVADRRTAMHKDCMVGKLIDAPTETFEEIVDRLEQGEALFGEDDE